MRNNSMLEAITSNLYGMLKSKGIGRVNPIFNDPPASGFMDHMGLVPDPPNSRLPFRIEFPRDLHVRPLVVNREDWPLPPALRWIAVGGLILRIEDTVASEECELILDKDYPVYIGSVLEAASYYARQSVVVIWDNLPISLIIEIKPSLKLKDQKEGWITDTARYFLKPEQIVGLQEPLSKIIDNQELDFRPAVQEIINLSGRRVRVGGSCCLTCGEPIEKLNTRAEPNFFCRAEWRYNKKTDTWPNRDNCRNKFRNWQKARLGLKHAAEQKKHRSLMYRELQDLFRSRPLTAFKDLQKNHPDLYKDGRK